MKRVTDHGPTRTSCLACAYIQMASAICCTKTSRGFLIPVLVTIMRMPLVPPLNLNNVHATESAPQFQHRVCQPATEPADDSQDIQASKARCASRPGLLVSPRGHFAIILHMKCNIFDGVVQWPTAAAAAAAAADHTQGLVRKGSLRSGIAWLSLQGHSTS